MGNGLWPDFLIIGAGKSGTTSLDHYLKLHPQIFMADLKEPNFFAMEEMDPDERAANEYYMRSIVDKEEYLSLFKDAPEGRLKGETSPMYLYHPEAPERIKKYVPDVKLIAILRNPVERLYSRYMHLARENDLPTPSFSDCLDRNSVWWERPDLVTEGFYYTNLKRYYDTFDQSQIKVFLFEDIKNNMGGLLSEMFEFLGVEDADLETDVQYNKSGVKKSKLYDYTLGHNSIIKYGMKSLFPSIYRNFKESNRLKKVVFGLQNYNLQSPKLDPELRSRINNEIYKEEVENLSKLINRDLSFWL